jgi:predicted nucleic acid-binding protein
MRKFFDTNVLVYLVDRSDGVRQARANAVFAEAVEADQVVLSAQVLQELFVTVTRKLARPLPREDAGLLLKALVAFPVVPIDAELVLAAAALSARHRLSYWDGAIVAAALAGGATELLSEDLQHNRVIEGITIVNPFKSEFRK